MPISTQDAREWNVSRELFDAIADVDCDRKSHPLDMIAALVCVLDDSLNDLGVMEYSTEEIAEANVILDSLMAILKCDRVIVTDN